MVSTLSTDRWVKCISTEGNIRGVAIHATDLIQEMVNRHQLKGDSIRGFGEAVMGALLIASYCKVGQRINLNVQGSGNYKQALIEAFPDGKVRGYLVPRENPPQFEEGIGPWGTGLLSVLRTKNKEGETPYIGTVPLLTGHLAKDLSFYWVQSEQIPSAVGLSVEMKGDQVVSAGGFLVQALPGASVNEVKTIEHHIQELQSLAASLKKDSDPLKLLSQIFQSTAFIVVEEKAVEFHCNCSWERVERALALVGVDELNSMLAENQGAIVRCDFCGKEFQVEKATLERLIVELSKMPS